MANDWLDAEQVLERLGIRPQTLYAYVSRGRIEAAAHPDDPRRSLYRASDVAVLHARKARGRRAADVAAEAIAWGEPVLASAITTVAGGTDTLNVINTGDGTSVNAVLDLYRVPVDQLDAQGRPTARVTRWENLSKTVTARRPE